MCRRKLLRYWLALTCVLLAWPLPSGLAGEAPAKPEEAAPAITVGQVQWLEAGGERFLGIYTKDTTGTPLGGAIILPGLAVPPDRQDVIFPLRQELPDHGWSTLAIALPTPAKGADGLWQLEPYFTASRNRIQAAIAYLQQQGITTVVLIGHGLGAAAATLGLSGTDPLKIAAFAAISLGVPPDSSPNPYNPELLESIHVPMLDIYGSGDMDEVTKTAAARVAAARRGQLAMLRTQQPEPSKDSATALNGNTTYRQLELMGADHLFRGAEPMLLKRVEGWLKKHAAVPVLPATALNKG